MNDTPQYDSNFDAADQKLSTLDHDGEWTAPTYQWNAESIERLHAMPVGELISRLQILISAVNSQKNIRATTAKTHRAIVEARNVAIEDETARFDAYKDQTLNPNRYTHPVAAKNVNAKKSHSLNISWWAIIAGAILFYWLFTVTERLTFTSYLVAIPVGIFQIALFFGLIAATIIKLVQHFLSTSELVAGFQERRAYHREIRENQRQVQEERKLDDLDRQFQEDNPQLTDTELRKRYQLDETIDSLNLEPTYELNELIKQIGPRDADYSWIVLDNAQYFPPKMLHDFPRLVKIHQILIDGGASNWAGALQALKADEANKRIFAQFNQLHDEVEESSIIASQAIQATQEQLEKAIDSVSANVTEYSKEVDQFASDAERARAALAGAISSLESRAARDPFMRY